MNMMVPTWDWTLVRIDLKDMVREQVDPHLFSGHLGGMIHYGKNLDGK